MHREFAELLNCPAPDCGAPDLTLAVESVEAVEYRTGAVEEVREGALACARCGSRYPIRDFVPSFEGVFPTELREEARYWSDWYGFFWDKGYRGFFDLRAPIAHMISRGIEVYDPHTLDGRDLPGTHTALADHPAVREAARVLDVGCGCGWSSLYLARRGHSVVAFDPSVDNVTRAKLYAISQGEYIEYLAAGLGYLGFKPGLFDALFALHSIHHVPNLRNEIALVRDWLRDGGVVAVDEHVQTDPTLDGIRVEMESWFTREAAPRHTTIGREEMEGLPRSPHSRLEDAGSSEVLGALIDNFAIESFQARFVSLDLFGFTYYLARGCDIEGYRHAGEVVHQIYRFLERAYPERAEYVTVIGRKSPNPGPANEEVARGLAALLGRDSHSTLLTDAHDHLLGRLSREAEHLKSELDALTDPQHGLKASRDAAFDALDTLRSTVRNLNETIHAKDRHIAEMEDALARQQEELARKQAALDDYETHLKRVESGRLMRFMKRLTRGQGSGVRGQE
jgi:SAM-dependent methyltransferase